MKEAKAEYAKLQQQEKSCLLAYCLAMVAVTTVALKFPVAEVSVIGDFSRQLFFPSGRQPHSNCLLY